MAKSLTAIMELVRTVGSLDFWRIVKNSWRCDAQNSELKKADPIVDSSLNKIKDSLT